MDILGQSALLVGMTSFGLGASLLARNARNKLFIAFAAVTTLVSGWALAFFLERSGARGSPTASTCSSTSGSARRRSLSSA